MSIGYLFTSIIEICSLYESVLVDTFLLFLLTSNHPVKVYVYDSKRFVLLYLFGLFISSSLC